ncbi:MAG TPA: MFS transporter [Chloroflexota bacterium]|nr:MFS transporter [Chloroflexota bacterium]
MSGSVLFSHRDIAHRLRIDAFGVDGYPSLWLANLAWNVARWMDQITAGWIAFELTHSVLLVALIGFYRSVPLFVLGLFGGAIGDQVDRRRLIVFVQVLNVTCVAVLAILSVAHRLGYLELAAGEVIMGIGMAVDWPSRRALTADLVTREHLTNAIALDSTAMNISRTVGPFLSGAVIAALSWSSAYATLGLLYCVSGLLVARIPPSVVKSRGLDRRVWRGLTEGIGEVLKDQAIVGVLMVTVVMNLLFFPFQQVLPVEAADVLHQGAIGLGTLVAADGFGSLLGTLGIATLVGHRRHGILFLVGSMAGCAALIGFSLVRGFTSAACLLFVEGIGRAGFSAFQSTIILRNCTVALRSRAMGVLTLAIGVGPFGALEIGILAEVIGTPRAILANACICLAWISIIAVRSRQLREA